MADVEIKRKIRLSRQEAGERLIPWARRWPAGSTSELDFDGDSIRFTVADELAGSSSWRSTATRSSSRSS